MPPVVVLLNYISSGILGGIFAKLGHSAGFSLYIISFAVYLCTSAQGVFNMPLCNTINSLNIKKRFSAA